MRLRICENGSNVIDDCIQQGPYNYNEILWHLTTTGNNMLYAYIMELLKYGM